jgi:uncharacterized small protein (DUF1192 family)
MMRAGPWPEEQRAMELDDLRPRTPKPGPRDLSAMSIDELHAYIAEMEQEINRVRGEIARKAAHRAGLDGLFKTPG